MEKKWFSAGFIFKKFANLWYILSVQDMRFKDLKTAGGMSEKGDKNPLETACRESRQELGVEITSAVQVYDYFRINHFQYYFLVEASGLPALDEERKISEMKAGRKGDSLHMRWVTLKEFHTLVYEGQTKAFANAVLKRAELDEGFAVDNMELLSCLSE